MDKRTFSLLEKYMMFCMEDSAHDKEHIYRVLYHALEIAKSESDVNYDILITSCLLHDIGRMEQYKIQTYAMLWLAAKRHTAF